MNFQLSNFQQDLNIFFDFLFLYADAKIIFYASTVNNQDLFTWGLSFFRCNDIMQNKLIFIFFLMQWRKYKYTKYL
jgi:hypothetical protein